MMKFNTEGLMQTNHAGRWIHSLSGVEGPPQKDTGCGIYNGNHLRELKFRQSHVTGLATAAIAS